MKKLILIGLLFTAHVFAGSAAKVLFTKNKVLATRNGVERVLSRGSVLNPGDAVSTAEDALANIQYENGTLVNIGSHSNYKILAYAPKKSDTQIRAELTLGKIEIKTPAKIKETLKTPIVSLAILGTHVRVAVTSAKMTYIELIDGLVWARNQFLRPGDSVQVTADHMVTAPFPKEGIVASPANSPGKITTGGSSSSTPSVPPVVADNTVQTIGTSTTAATQLLQEVNSIDISCQVPIDISCEFPSHILTG